MNYSYQNVPEWYLGMILDEYGKITELIPMPNTKESPYVDNIFTLKPKGTFVSYQYSAANHFVIGFKYFDSNGTLVTTPNRMLNLEIFSAKSIGGSRTLVKSHEFSTDFEDAEKKYSDYYTTIGGGPFIQLIYDGNLSGSYYNGVVTNLSSESANVRINVFAA